MLIALAVIVLPMILDGAGSESQQRAVEQLREEPPALDLPVPELAKAIPERQSVPRVQPESESELQPDQQLAQQPELQPELQPESQNGPTPVPVPSVEALNESEAEPGSGAEPITQPSTDDPLNVWVVQAGAFDSEDNAVQLRDELRSAGFASFVQNPDVSSSLFLVLVGPMIKEQSATRARDQVARLLQNNPVVSTYQ